MCLGSWVGTIPVCVAKDRWGLGVMVGAPTGLTVKWENGDLARRYAWNLVMGWNLSEKNARVLVQVDYLKYRSEFLEIDQKKVDLYYGLGARIFSESQRSWFGVRLPGGLRYFFRPDLDDEFELFAETALGLMLIDRTEAFIDFAVGVRYIF